MLLIAWLPAVVALLLCPVIHERPPAASGREQAEETATLLGLYGGSLALAGLLLAAMLVRVRASPPWRCLVAASDLHLGEVRGTMGKAVLMFL